MCSLWWKRDRTTTWSIVQVCSMPKTKLNCNQSDRVQSMMKIRKDNDVIDCISAISAEIGTWLSWSIGQDAMYHKNHIGQRRDRSYSYDLHRIRYWTIKTDQIVCGLWQRQDRAMTWQIILVCSMLKTKLNYHDQFGKAWSTMKSKQENDVIGHTSAVYAKIETKLSLLIGQDAVYHKNQIGQWCDQSYKCDLCRIRYWTIKTDKTMCGLWWR